MLEAAFEVLSKDKAKHKSKEDAWIVIHGDVFDVTKWLDSHPGGAQILLTQCGKDGTEMYETMHPPDALETYGKAYKIGSLEGAIAKPAAVTPAKGGGDKGDSCFAGCVIS